MEIGLRILARLALALSLGVLPSAQSSRAAGSPAALGPHRPFLRTTLVSPAQAPVNEELSFDVTVVDPDGDPVTLSIANPPAGMIVEPLVGAPSPATTRVRWKLRGGRETVVFEARDARDPTKVGRLAVTAEGTGGSYEDGTLVGDISGDGVMDLVVNATFADVSGVIDAGAYHVWVGGTAPSGPPDATLAVPGAHGADRLGDHAGNGTSDQPAQLVDVDGDGLLDLVAGTAWTNLPGVGDAGAVYVWKGKPSWSGTMAPDATLVVPGAHNNDELGMISGSQGIVLGDFTADGQLDLVVGAPNADVNGGTEVGAVYVWAGGSSLAGTVGPTAVLSVPGASFGEYLGAGPHLCQRGLGGCTQSLLLQDVSGDGTPDVLALTTRARIAGVDGAGAVFVWHGGAGLSGPLAPTATLAVPGSVVNDSLGTITGSGGLLVADVSGDGTADIVSGSYLADVGGTQDRGAVYVWQGGPALTGTIAPLATLVSASVRLGDLDSAPGISLLDWNSDSVLDLLAGSAGGLFLWQGGPTLAGNPAPSAVLTAGASDSASSRLSLLADVTGDGLPDVVAGSTEVDAGGIGNRGAIHVWSGGPGRTGTLAPTAVLMHSPAQSGDAIGRFFLSDVDADGFEDVVSWSTNVDLPGATLAGAIFVWSGGPGLVGNLGQRCRFTVPGAASIDALGASGILHGDLTHDGIPDIVAVSSLADPGGLVDAGAAYVFRGELGLAGERTPWATLLEPSPMAGSSFGIGTHLLADLDGNGRLDLVLGARAVTVAGVPKAGAVFLWRGGSTLQGTPVPSRILTRASPVAMDRLGESGIRLVDLRGTGQLDLLAGAESADVSGVSDTGAVFLWSAPLLPGSGPATTLFVPGAQSGDSLGR